MIERCQNCGETLHRLMVKALLETAGAKVYPSALHCSEGVEHDFYVHLSDCPMNNEPAYPKSACDCRNRTDTEIDASFREGGQFGMGT